MSTSYCSPADDLAMKLGLFPRFRYVSGIGGNSPQTLINMAADLIVQDKLDSVLVVGAEAYVRRKERVVENQMNKTDHILFQGIPKDYKGDDFIGATDLEIRHGMKQPMHGFPLFETALWGDSNMELEDWLKKIGSMWSGFSSCRIDCFRKETDRPCHGIRLVHV